MARRKHKRSSKKSRGCARVGKPGTKRNISCLKSKF